jgi:SAM-dependent methyltransferase
MPEPQIRFDDGAAYERMMGTWSRLAGAVFLDWLAPSANLRWIDVGCGNGAFTELIVEKCAPSEVQGVDPSEGQLAFARARPASRIAKFHQGNALALPFEGSHFDVAVMALVIFFVPEPTKGVDEMVRVVRPGGLVAAYAWDMFGGGYPGEPIQAEMRAMGLNYPRPPRPEASRIEVLRELWTDAGLDAVETRDITVRRTFANFDELWTITMQGSSIGPAVAALPAADAEVLRQRVQASMATDATGRITYEGRANAIKGRVPAKSAKRV